MTTSWLLNQINPAPHLLDPKETRKSSARYYNGLSVKALEKEIAEYKRAIEHEQAILEGIGDALIEAQHRIKNKLNKGEENV
jgi:hypothetical protein